MENKPYKAHPTALCESQKIGDGAIIGAFSHIQPDAIVGAGTEVGSHVFIESSVTVGNDCKIQSGVAIWDKVVLGNNVAIGAYAVFTNVILPRAFIKRGKSGYTPTQVGDGAWIGSNSTIVCGVTLGEYCEVEAGSVVTRDVPARTRVAGNPARKVGRAHTKSLGHNLAADL